MYDDEELILISGLQHLAFCERQWMLIHVEKLWAENILTIEGSHLHSNVHQTGSKSRGDVKLSTGLQLRSSRLGLYGVADMVEFHRDDDLGVAVRAFGDDKKRWTPYPIEYKRGRKRWDIADEIQLCAQAICLEEMLQVDIHRGAVYDGEPKHRTEIELTQKLRLETEERCERARALMTGIAQPDYKHGKQCKNCSMNEFCMPEDVSEEDHSARYIARLYRDACADNDGRGEQQ